MYLEHLATPACHACIKYLSVASSNKKARRDGARSRMVSCLTDTARGARMVWYRLVHTTTRTALPRHMLLTGHASGRPASLAQGVAA